jgi:hypothetical protein
MRPAIVERPVALDSGVDVDEEPERDEGFSVADAALDPPKVRGGASDVHDGKALDVRLADLRRMSLKASDLVF